MESFQKTPWNDERINKIAPWFMLNLEMKIGKMSQTSNFKNVKLTKNGGNT